MIPAVADNRKKEAFELFNAGKYAESLAVCTQMLDGSRDPALEILAATNLFSLEKFDDAEVHFRDLARRMPESSHVHSYLARVLAHKNDENAIAEFAIAARLDPVNLDALRCYAAELVARHDDRGALPALKQLWRIGKRPDDLRHLIAVLIRSGFAEEACHLCEEQEAGQVPGREYAEALHACERFRDAAMVAKKCYEETRDPAVLRISLAACSRADREAAPVAYALSLKEVSDPGIWLDYTRLLQDRGETLRALAAAKKLLGLDPRLPSRLIVCELSAELGDQPNALKEYEALVQDSLVAPGSPEEMQNVLRSYRRYLEAHFPPTEAKKRFLVLVSDDANVTALAESGGMYHEQGEESEAKALYYRAYRADFLKGGLAYAGYLATCGDTRECEKVLLHILANVRKHGDLSRVAAAVTEHDNRLHGLKRVTRQLIRCLEERRQTLSADDRECLAAAYMREATAALSSDDYSAGMYNCLRGIEILPAYSRTCHAGDFLPLITRAKKQMISDIPVMSPPAEESADGPKEALQVLLDSMALSGPEQKIVLFLAMHRRANETDLRRLLGTRRVAGMVNMLIRKTKAQGIMLIEKKGMSTEGEVYDYCGP